MLSVITGIVVKYSDLITTPFIHQAAGAPIYVSGMDLPADFGSEPLARMLQGGVTYQDYHLMASGMANISQVEDLGVPVGIAKLRVVVQAKDSQPLLTGLRLVVDHPRTPLRGTLLAAGTQGGPGKPIQVLFDADDKRAITSQGAEARNLDGQNYFEGNNYELDPGQSVEFRASVTTRRCDCLWHLEVDAMLDGKTYSVAVHRADGTDFEVTAATQAVREAYEVPTPSDTPQTILGTIGPWMKVPPAELCASPSLGMFCNPSIWP